MKLSEIQHFIATIHEELISPSLLDGLHNLEWLALAVAGHAGNLAVAVKQVRRDGIDVFAHTSETDLARSVIAEEAADTLRHLIALETLIGESLSAFLDDAVERARDFAQSRNLDLEGIATRGGTLSKYLTPRRLAKTQLDQHEQHEPVDQHV